MAEQDVEQDIDWKSLEDFAEEVPCQVNNHEHKADVYCRSRCAHCGRRGSVAGVCYEFASWIYRESAKPETLKIICRVCKQGNPIEDFYTVLGKVGK